jgi:hypothetical protein
MGEPARGDFAVREVGSAWEVAEVRRLVIAHGGARATTAGVEYVNADATALPGPYAPQDDVVAAQKLYASLNFSPVPRSRAEALIDTRFFERRH